MKQCLKQIALLSPGFLHRPLRTVLILLYHRLVLLIIKGEIEDDSNNEEGQEESDTDQGERETQLFGLSLVRGLKVS